MNHRSHLTILVIDDCAEDREMYHQYLQQDRLYTHNILEFQTAKQAMTWCQQQTPDVILLDYLLPDDDGLGFLQNLRENLNNSQSAVIMLTGQGDETIAVRAIKKGAQDYLVKNYLTPEILQSAIHHAVELMLLTRQLEQSRQQQQMMAAIALRIRQSIELQEILTVTAAEVRQFLQTDRVVIYEFQPDLSGIVVAESILPGWTVAMKAQIQDNCFQNGAGLDYHQGKKRAIDDIYQVGFTNCYLELLEQFEVKACLVVPILVTNKLWGLLIAHQCTAPRHWQSFELDLLDQLAVQIAIAIQQASAYQQAQAELRERKQAEAHLKSSEARFQAFMNNSPAASWITDEHGRILYLSQTCLRTFQLPSEKLEDVIGKTVFEVYPAEIAQQFVDNIRQVAQTQQILETIELAPRPDGTLGDFLIYKFPLPRTTKQLMIGGVAVDITDKIRAEQALQQLNLELEARVEERTAALQESEERWHLALRGSNDGIWDWNIKTNEVFFSARWEEMLGFAENEFSHNFAAWLSRIHLNDRDRFMKAMADHTAHKTPFCQEEYQIKCKDGSYIWVLDRGQALWDEFGNAIRMSGSATDITKRKQTEEQLHNLSDRLTLALKSANIAIWDWNMIQDMDWDDRMYELYDLQRSDKVAVYQDWVDRLHPDDLVLAKTSFQDAVLGVKEFDTEFRIILSDGSIRFIKASALVQRNERGESQRMVGINYDITDRKQTEIALRESEHRYATLTEAAPVAIFRLDAASNCIYVNERWGLMTGRPTTAALGKGWLENIHLEDCDRLLIDWSDPCEQTYKLHETCRQEVRYLRPDGCITWFYMQIVPETNPSGTLIGYIGTLTDITIRKEIESEVNHHRDLREAIFNESTDALFLVDSDTQLIFDCNRRAVELFEVSEKEELINIQGNTLQRYEFTPQELDEIIQEVNHKSSWSREIEYATRKGNFFWGNLATKQIIIAGKTINLVRLSDISEQQAALRERKKAVEQIQRSLEEKETLLKEIHHRVKNNLQIISSLLRMQSRRSGDETTLLLFKESQDRVQSMALIHEQLYQSADIYEINFDNYIKSLIDSLFRSYGVSQKNIILNIETNGIKLPLDTAIPCGLIINELVSNCLKYAFPDKKKKGKITISLQQSPENQLVLVVKDTGIGIPETLDWENSNSLGLRIVKNLVRQLKGNILLERVGVDRISLRDAARSLLPQSSTTKLSYHRRYHGTTFYINFPQ